MTPDQEQKLNEVYDFIQKLKADSTIPYEVDQAFRKRLGIASFTPLVVSAKGTNSEDVSINESGIASHTVLADPSGFLQITIGSTAYHIPYYPT